MSTTTDILGWTPAQTAALQAMQNSQQYPQAYRYLQGLANDASTRASTPEQRRDLQRRGTWLERAASINGDDKSFPGDLVRNSK